MIEILWLVCIVAFIFLEAVTYQMICLWFIGGSLGGLICALMGGDFWTQMIVFLVVSVALLICFRPIALKKLKTEFKSNADALVGKKARITQTVDNAAGTGQAKVDGMEWTVRTDSDEVLPEGAVAEVKRIEGVKLIVD